MAADRAGGYPTFAIIAWPIGFVIDGELDGFLEIVLDHGALEFIETSSREA